MKNLLLLLAVAILTTSCYTQRGLAKKSDFKVDLFSKDNLNGLYENAVPEDNRNSLWQDLYKNESHKDLVFNASNTQVELKLVSDELLKVILYRRGYKEDELELEGKIKNGYFVIDRKLILIPIPILYYHSENKTIIGNDEEGNLVLVQGQMTEFVFLFSVFGGDSDVISARYAKL